jgi:hypothetical protein
MIGPREFDVDEDVEIHTVDSSIGMVALVVWEGGTVAETLLSRAGLERLRDACDELLERP